MSEREDYYRRLGVPRDADAKTITAAFRKLAAIHHPDRNPGNPEAEEKFKEISEAYEVLRDPERRAAYDASLGSAGFGRTAFFRQNGRDMETELEIPLEDTRTGGVREIVLETPYGARSAVIEIPRGFEDGHRIRIPGKGMAGGDLYVILRYMPHTVFTVVGKDIYCEVTVAPWESLFGLETTVPTLDGELSLSLSRARDGRIVLEGEGLGPRGRRGDLNVIVTIDWSFARWGRYALLAGMALLWLFSVFCW